MMKGEVKLKNIPIERRYFTLLQYLKNFINNFYYNFLDLHFYFRLYIAEILFCAIPNQNDGFKL